MTALTLCGFASFLFGWHVHEKAVLLVLIPLSMICTENQAYFRTFTIASFAGIAALFPLIFTPAETVLAVGYSLAWAISVIVPLSRRMHQAPRSLLSTIVDRCEILYLWGFLPLEVLVLSMSALTYMLAAPPGSAEHELGADNVRHLLAYVGQSLTVYEFLPLMLTSVYCAAGLCWSFARLSVLYLRQ